VFMTGFYIFRAFFMTFHGEFKGGSTADPAAQPSEDAPHLAESPSVMVFPMVLLALSSIGAGFLANPLTDLGIVPVHWFSHFLSTNVVEVSTHEFNKQLAAISSTVAFGGIGLAFLMYRKSLFFKAFEGLMRPVHVLLSRKYYFDEAYEDYLTKRGLYSRFALAVDWFDMAVVDGFVDTVGWFGRNTGRALARLQTGQLQAYGLGISLGILVIFGVFIIWR